MKNIKYIIFVILCTLSNIFYVNASCTEEELNQLKEEVNDINITYKHMGEVDLGDLITYDRFEVNIKDINDDFYILISGLEKDLKLVPSDRTANCTLYHGTWNFEIYSNQCNSKIGEIDVVIPRFNTYSLDPLCEGIDGYDFALCGKYYEYDVNYEDFVTRVTYYRSTHNLNSDGQDDEEKSNFKLILSTLLKIIEQYKVYILIILILILVIISFIIFKRKRNRGVLK